MPWPMTLRLWPHNRSEDCLKGPRNKAAAESPLNIKQRLMNQSWHLTPV